MLRSDETPFRRARPVFRAVILVAGGVMLAQCEREAEPPVPPSSPVAPTPVAPIVVTPSATLPTLSRAGLLESVNRAASAYAAGEAAGETAGRGDPLVGRTFAIRLPFACSGPAPVGSAGADGAAVAVWGADRTTVQLALTPVDWTGSPLIAGGTDANSGASSPWEAVEGFWIPRPWLAAETCPVISRQTGSPESPQTVGLASVFEAGGSRLTRRNGRAYAFTRRAEGDEPLTAPTGGYRVLLEGRIAAFPNGRAIRCRAASPDQRPVCVAAVQMDRVAFEDAKGAVLSEWRKG